MVDNVYSKELLEIIPNQVRLVHTLETFHFFLSSGNLSFEGYNLTLNSLLLLLSKGKICRPDFRAL